MSFKFPKIDRTTLNHQAEQLVSEKNSVSDIKIAANRQLRLISGNVNRKIKIQNN